MLDVLVPEIRLEGAGIVTVIRQLVAAGMSQHVRMRLKGELGLDPSALNHARESSRAKGRTALGREYEWRLRLLLTLKSPQSAQFVA
jgi:hypothetical protein